MATLGRISDWRLLEQLLESQQRRCVYTGELLIPGINASLDHRIPVAQNGTDEIGNLQWVTKRVNAMKSDCSHEEFIKLCRTIAARN